MKTMKTTRGSSFLARTTPRMLSLLSVAVVIIVGTAFAMRMRWTDARLLSAVNTAAMLAGVLVLLLARERQSIQSAAPSKLQATVVLGMLWLAVAAAVFWPATFNYALSFMLVLFAIIDPRRWYALVLAALSATFSFWQSQQVPAAVGEFTKAIVAFLLFMMVIVLDALLLPSSEETSPSRRSES